MGNIDVISIYRYHCDENIDMISILIFANIAIPRTDGSLLVVKIDFSVIDFFRTNYGRSIFVLSINFHYN